MSKNEPTLEEFRESVKDLPPTLVLALMYKEAPSGVRQFIDMHTGACLGLELPKLHAIVEEGPLALRADLPTLTSAYTDAMSGDNAPPLTATVQDAGEVIAAAIDKAVSRTLLDETECNRMEYLNLVTLHARIVSALDQLEITDEQRGLMAKAQEEDNAAVTD